MGADWETSTDPNTDSVSVIIPVYNGAKFIAETLESILGQTVRPAEVIVVNDGSTDNTVSVVEEFGDSVTMIHIQNSGQDWARNLGASQAKGYWLAFCDQDDLWLPAKLEKQLRLANEVPDIHCVLTDYAEMANGVVADRSHFSYVPVGFWPSAQSTSTGFAVRDSIVGKLTIFQPGITSTTMVRRDFFFRVGGFDVEARIWGAEDTCFHFRCLSVVPFGVVPEVLMYYRRHPDQESANAIKQLRDTVCVWNYIIANYPQAQPWRTELLNGLVATRKEIREMENYRRRQKLKSCLGIKAASDNQCTTAPKTEARSSSDEVRHSK